MDLKHYLFEALFRSEDENKLKAFEQLLGSDFERFKIDIYDSCAHISTADKNTFAAFNENVIDKIITAARVSTIKKICFEHRKGFDWEELQIDKGIDFRNIEIECKFNLRIECTKKGLVPLTNIKNLDMNGYSLRFYRSPKLINVHIENANKITFEHTISLSPCKNSTLHAERIYLDITEKQNVLYSKLNKYLSLNRGYQAAGEYYSLISHGNETALKCIGWDPKSYFTQLFKVETKDGYVEAKI